METDCQDLYQAALQEHDSTKITDVRKQARRVIHDQLLVLARQHGTRSRTTEDLEEALRQLLIHETRVHRAAVPSRLANTQVPDAKEANAVQWQGKVSPDLWHSLPGIKSARAYPQGATLSRRGTATDGVYVVEPGQVDLPLPAAQSRTQL